MKDAPLSTSRAALPSSLSSRIQGGSTHPKDGNNVAPAQPKGPPTAPRGAVATSNQESLSSLSHFFPDAAPRNTAEANQIPRLAPVEPTPSPLLLIDRISTTKQKKVKPRMVPIGSASGAPKPALEVKTSPKEASMPPPAVPRQATNPSATASSLSTNEAQVTPLITPTKPPTTESLPKAVSPTGAIVPPLTPLVPASNSEAAISAAKPRKPEDLYKIMAQVGEGTFGKVYKAKNQITGVYVALKRIRMEGEKDGFPVTAMREIKLLQSLKHPNVVKLHEMMVSKGLFHIFSLKDMALTLY